LGAGTLGAQLPTVGSGQRARERERRPWAALAWQEIREGCTPSERDKARSDGGAEGADEVRARARAELRAGQANGKIDQQGRRWLAKSAEQQRKPRAGDFLSGGWGRTFLGISISSLFQWVARPAGQRALDFDRHSARAAALGRRAGPTPWLPASRTCFGFDRPAGCGPGPGTTLVALGGPWWTHLVCPVSRAACREEEGRRDLPASPTTGSVPAWSQSSALVPRPLSSPPLHSWSPSARQAPRIEPILLPPFPSLKQSAPRAPRTATYASHIR
jgi:hypothetical protein